jgi:hypothetical protein
LRDAETGLLRAGGARVNIETNGLNLPYINAKWLHISLMDNIGQSAALDLLVLEPGILQVATRYEDHPLGAVFLGAHTIGILRRRIRSMGRCCRWGQR